MKRNPSPKPNYIVENSKYIIKYECGPDTPAQNKPSKCNQSYGGSTKTKTFVFSSERCSFHHSTSPDCCVQRTTKTPRVRLMQKRKE
jgi:hypothetical protein